MRKRAGILWSLAVLVPSCLTFAQDLPLAVRTQMQAINNDKSARTPVERKLDSKLMYLSREAAGLRAVEGAPAFRSGVARQTDGSVVVEISAMPSPSLTDAIMASGGLVLYESPRWSKVRASLPPAALLRIAARGDVKTIKPAPTSFAHTGPVTNQADAAHNAPSSRALFGVNGSGITTCVISDSDDFSEASVASGELPNYSVLPGRSGRPASGEGTAMSEIVADLAPGAPIKFANAGPGKAGFADSILLLRAAGCRIIVDDISYSDEWQFQDDEIGQAVNQVVADGALYLSSAGNEGSLKRGNSSTWEGNFVSGGPNSLIPGGTVQNFGTQNYNRTTNGSNSTVVLQWSDEYNTSANDYDLYILDATGTSIIGASNNTQDGDDEPIETVDSVNPGERIVIFKVTGAAPRYLRLNSPNGHVLEVQTAGQTIGHASTPNSMAVGASDAKLAFPGPFTTASPAEVYTSDGPHKMFYKPDGSLINPNGGLLASGGTTIQAPAITAGDGGATSVPGFAVFSGTSAAAPAAAGIAALVWSRQPSLTNVQVRAILESSTLDIEDPGFDNITGFGIVMTDLALPKSGARPTISKAFNPASIVSGGSSTVTLTLSNSNPAALTGGSFSDTLTNMRTVGGSVGGTCVGTIPVTLAANATALSFSGITIPASSNCTVTFSVTSTNIAVNPNTTSGVTTTQIAAAGPVSNTAMLTVTAGPPTVVSYNVICGSACVYNVVGTTRVRLPWQITGVRVIFSQVITSANINSLTGVPTTGFSGLGTTTLTWTFAGSNNVNLSTALALTGMNAISSAGGTLTGSNTSKALKILQGDFSDDGVVNASDQTLVNNARSAPFNLFADINGDGIVDTIDVTVVRTRNGQTNP